MAFYFTGKPCKQGHVAERYVRGWNCAACHKYAPEQYQRKRTKKNFLNVGIEWEEYEELKAMADKRNISVCELIRVYIAWGLEQDEDQCHQK